jgi:uncharacterized protein (TIGR00297 family)
MPIDWRDAGVGLIVAFCAAAAAWRCHALTESGAWAAAFLGGALAVSGGWTWLALVAVFFITSSALTRLSPRSPDAARRSGDLWGRAWDQVAANGGVAALAAVGYRLTGAPAFFVAACGAIAAATADTWATEAGRWSAVPPRLITAWRVVPHGTSGAITPVGTAAAAAGALLIGLVAAALRPGGPSGQDVVAVAAAGFVSALIDSVLGASVEGRWPGVTNSAINLAATTFGALLAVGATRL